MQVQEYDFEHTASNLYTSVPELLESRLDQLHDLKQKSELVTLQTKDIKFGVEADKLTVNGATLYPETERFLLRRFLNVNSLDMDFWQENLDLLQEILSRKSKNDEQVWQLKITDNRILWLSDKALIVHDLFDYIEAMSKYLDSFRYKRNTLFALSAEINDATWSRYSIIMIDSKPSPILASFNLDANYQFSRVLRGLSSLSLGAYSVVHGLNLSFDTYKNIRTPIVKEDIELLSEFKTKLKHQKKRLLPNARDLAKNLNRANKLNPKPTWNQNLVHKLAQKDLNKEGQRNLLELIRDHSPTSFAFLSKGEIHKSLKFTMQLYHERIITNQLKGFLT